MNDEAAAYYPAIIMQLTEGHEWLRREFDYKPRSGYFPGFSQFLIFSRWSIDPFGYSPTQAYLLSLSGFEHMLIQR
jgi:alpha-mannosidase II